MRKLTKSLLMAAVAAMVMSGVQAQAYTYGDLLLNLRSWDGSSAGSKDITVDLGQYSSLTAGTVAHVDLSTLNGGNLDNIQFSVVGYTKSGSSTETMYATTARTGQTVDGSVQGDETALYNIAYSSLNQSAAQITSIATGTVTDSTTGTSYHAITGDNGDFKGKFQSSVEQTTGTGFASSSTGVSEDLYLLSTSASAYSDATYKGFFTLNSNGDVVFSGVPEPTTFGILAAAGLLLVSTRRQLRKQA